MLAGLIEIRFLKPVNRTALIKRMQEVHSVCGFYFVRLYNETDYDYYKAVDLQSGKSIYIQVFDERLLINNSFEEYEETNEEIVRFEKQVKKMLRLL